MISMLTQIWNTFFPSFLGTPRTTADSYEEALKYGKQIKRESPPIRSFEGGISKGKPYEGVNTIKELGRSIHEIPRQDPSGQDLRKTPELSDRRVMESSLSQVLQFEQSYIYVLKVDAMYLINAALCLSNTRFTVWTSLLSSTMLSL